MRCRGGKDVQQIVYIVAFTCTHAKIENQMGCPDSLTGLAAVEGEGAQAACLHIGEGERLEQAVVVSGRHMG
jgi:hypothetical protein